MRSITLNRVNSILLFLALLFVVLYYGRPLWVPVTFAIFFAMLCKPISNKLENWGLNRVFSTLISLLVVMITAALILSLIFMQFKSLAAEGPKMKERSVALMKSGEDMLQKKLKLKPEQIEAGKKKIKKSLESSSGFFKKFFSSLTTLLTNVVLVLVFMFLFLLQREKYETFFLKLVKDEHKEQCKTMIFKISKVAQHYLTGRLLSVIIFTVLFTVGFLIVGIKGAFLLAFIAALLTIVPYVGSIIGGIFPFAVALVTSDSSSAAFGALAVIVIVQAIDNYFIEPYVIGGEVHISGLFTILILFVGGLLWGAAGMILFIPMLGVAKIIFDNFKELEPYGYLVGDQKKGSQSDRMLNWFKKIFKK